jgi:hypothetical protein
MSIKGETCPPGCTCGRHSRARCLPGCTCKRHNPSPQAIARLRSMSANRLGAKSSEEHCRKIASALTGRPLSEEHRAKIAALQSDPIHMKKRSAARKAKRKPAETWGAMHARIRLDNGHAREHQCVDCGEQADAWTHDWSTWENVAQDIRGKRLTFSTDPKAYLPRCHGCHNRLDRQPAPWDDPGTRRGTAKLTESDVSWIRASDLRPGLIAKKFGILPSTVRMIRIGATWSDVNS